MRTGELAKETVLRIGKMTLCHYVSLRAAEPRAEAGSEADAAADTDAVAVSWRIPEHGKRPAGEQSHDSRPAISRRRMPQI